MANVSFGDAARDQLRTLVETIEGEITRLPAHADGKPAAQLHASWSELVKLLALGPKPELRECPVCHGSGLRAASRCSSCWAKLEPLVATPGAAAPLLGSLAAAAAMTTTARSDV